MTIGPLNPDKSAAEVTTQASGNQAARSNPELPGNEKETQKRTDSPNLGSDRFERSVENRQISSTYSLGEIKSQGNQRLLADDISKVRLRISEGYYRQAEVVKEVAGRIAEQLLME